MTRASDLARLMGAGGSLSGALSVDTISEKTSGSGVTIDSLNIKDSGIGGQQVGGRRNIVINGAMQVAQRGTSETGVGASAGYFTCDRWKIETNATAGRATMTQTADGPSGFANCLKLDCTTADTSIAASELFQISYKIEGQDLQQLKKGTSDAESVTISFYTKANGAFTFGLEVYDNDNTRQMTKLFATTTNWVRHELTFPPDTTGTLDDDNATSIFLSFWLHSGSTFAGGTLETSFASATNANRAAGIDSFFSSTDNNFFLTGVQMEVGEQATPFEHRSFGEELALCQRYFYRWDSTTSAYNNIALGYTMNANAARGVYQYPVRMRASPTLAHSGTFRVYDGDASRSVSDIDFQRTSLAEVFLNFDTSSATTNRPCEMGANNDTTCTIDFIAEL